MAVLMVGLAGSGCAQAPVEPPQTVVLRVTTTRGAPVAGAEVRLEGSLVARSDDSGAARFLIGGRNGESFAAQVQCPAPLKSPARPVVVRRLDIQGGAAEHSVKCEETQRKLLVAVRAENGPNLPILYLGNEIGRTDRSGAAHIKIDAEIHERVELALSTAEGDMVAVHPQNPIAAFEAADHDELREFAVTFTRDPKKVVRRAAPRGPQVF
jgi:hypothetical protein